MNKSYSSVHSAGIEQIHEMPLSEIIRPIPPQVNEEKVKSLMDTLSVSVLLICKYLVSRIVAIQKINLKIYILFIRKKMYYFINLSLNIIMGYN